MPDARPFRALMSEYARTIAGRYAIGEVLYRLTDQSLDLLAVDGAGISLGDDAGRLRFVTATGDDVVRVEEAQVGFQEGPCHDAFETGRRVVVDDLRELPGGRWDDYRSVAVGAGCVSVAGIPMFIEDRTIGALDLYREDAGVWSEDTLENAQLVADLASAYIVNDRTLTESRTLAEQLQSALESRVVIEQAKGILAERHAIDVAEAFSRLRTRSRLANRRLHDVARAVVEGRIDL